VDEVLHNRTKAHLPKASDIGLLKTTDAQLLALKQRLESYRHFMVNNACLRNYTLVYLWICTIAVSLFLLAPMSFP
jgi:hypothetical protein